jgi:hypothetical protein
MSDVRQESSILHSTLSRTLRTGGFAIALVALSGVLAHTALAAGASAYGITASFTSGGVTTVINPVNPLKGGTTTTFDKAKNSGAYQTMLLVAAGSTPVPALAVTAKNFLSHVKGGFGVDTISAEGDATTTGLDISLQLYPPVPGPVPQPFLHITAIRIKDTASYNLVVPTLAGVDAHADISGLAISGSLLHGVTLQYSGAPAQNHILFQSATMTITVNQRISAELISCEPKCVVTPVNISASALEITLTNANINGHKVSGQIDISGANAGSELPL